LRYGAGNVQWRSFFRSFGDVVVLGHR
jgi:hypothetical protein